MSEGSRGEARQVQSNALAEEFYYEFDDPYTEPPFTSRYRAWMWDMRIVDGQLEARVQVVCNIYKMRPPCWIVRFWNSMVGRGDRNEPQLRKTVPMMFLWCKSRHYEMIVDRDGNLCRRHHYELVSRACPGGFRIEVIDKLYASIDQQALELYRRLTASVGLSQDNSVSSA